MTRRMPKTAGELVEDDSYPDRLREGIAQSLSFRKAAPAWPAIVEGLADHPELGDSATKKLGNR